MLQVVDLTGAGTDVRGRLPRPAALADMPVDAVRAIIDEVRRDGDESLRRCTLRFDKVVIDEIRVDPATVAESLKIIETGLRSSLVEAASRIEAYQTHRARCLGLGEEDRFEKDGIAVVTRLAPVHRAGIYVPGGAARYPSTVLMTAIPARVAGVAEIAMCVPPGSGGDPPVETLAAAAIAGVDEVYRIGGAQAVAALAYGTESVSAVDLVAGPGNIYVSLAQREVRGVVGVPGSFAGPSEVVVVADGSSPVDWVAVDLAVQAEHGPDGMAWLVAWDREVIDKVGRALESVVATSPRKGALQETLSRHGYAALVDGPEAAVAVVNAVAPEHLEVMCAEPRAITAGVVNAGAVFIGTMAPASIGDYLAGPSHVLPTHRSARFAGALSVADFTRETSEIRVASVGFGALSRSVATIARAEGLEAHAHSVELRCSRSVGMDL